MQGRYGEIRSLLEGHHVRLVAVSKTRSAEEIMELYESGQRDFGENRVPEMRIKQATLPPDIRWHMIGHLQKNKVKYIAPWIFMIQSVDSPELLESIHLAARKAGRHIPCLLQVHIAEEENKYGFSEETLDTMLSSGIYKDWDGIRIAGLMGMATNTENTETVRSEFHRLHVIFTAIKGRYFSGDPGFCELSMGMSGDFRTAMEEGSTMVRIGSLIFS